MITPVSVLAESVQVEPPSERSVPVPLNVASANSMSFQPGFSAWIMALIAFFSAVNRLSASATPVAEFVLKPYFMLPEISRISRMLAPFLFVTSTSSPSTSMRMVKELSPLSVTVLVVSGLANSGSSSLPAGGLTAIGSVSGI